MLRIEFNEQNISVPDSWADITLADYEKWFMHQSGERVQDVNLIAGICKIDAAMLMESPPAALRHDIWCRAVCIRHRFRTVNESEYQGGAGLFYHPFGQNHAGRMDRY